MISKTESSVSRYLAPDVGSAPDRPVADRVGKRLLLVAVAAALLVACTGESSEQSGQDQLPEDQTSSSQLVGQVETELGQEPDFLVNPIGKDGESVPDDQLVFADDEGLSEEVAEAPVLPDDEEVEIDLELTPEVPQAEVDVSEAALCATIQIGRDAVVDGDEAVANQQRDLLVERSAGISDQELSEILSKVTSDSPLDGDVAESALVRCSELGFER